MLKGITGGIVWLELRRFRVRVALTGSPEGNLFAAVPGLQRELEARPHVWNPSVRPDPEAHRVVLELEEEAFGPQHAADRAAEEILEVASAAVRECEVCHVAILGAQLSDGN
jgi:hypothetical protein